MKNKQNLRITSGRLAEPADLSYSACYWSKYWIQMEVLLTLWTN